MILESGIKQSFPNPSTYHLALPISVFILYVITFFAIYKRISPSLAIGKREKKKKFVKIVLKKDIVEM
jgi:hypothetical protein